MASVRITAEFSLTVRYINIKLRILFHPIIEYFFQSQPDNFCSFYDDQRQNWAVLFDSKDASQNFLLEVTFFCFLLTIIQSSKIIKLILSV